MEQEKGVAGLKEDLTVKNLIFSETPGVCVAGGPNLNTKDDTGEDSEKVINS